jgi:hypothetical protein
MIFFQGRIDEGIRMKEFVDVIAFGVVFSARQSDQVIAAINIIELFPSGLNQKVSGSFDLADESLIRPPDAWRLLSSFFPEPFQEQARNFQSGWGPDGLKSICFIRTGSAKDNQPISAHGPLESIMRPPDEKIRESPFRGLRLIFP